MNRNRHADMMRVATYVAAQFAIYTTDPKRLGDFARDLLAGGFRPTADNPALKESLERVAKW